MNFDEINLSDVEDEREAPKEREHETYTEQDNWSFVNLTAVDKLFVAGGARSSGQAGFGCNGALRVDLDGISTGGDVIDRGENINLSILLDDDAAEQLIAELESALRESRRESVNDAE